MNLFVREMKSGMKAFVWWMLALFLLVYAGTVKYTSMVGTTPDGAIDGATITELLAKFPRVILSMFGMNGVDITTLDGYYSVLVFYALLCICIYAITLGVHVVTREIADATYEFLFTKPYAKCKILAWKLLSAWIYLVLFAGMFYVFSIITFSSMDLLERLTSSVLLYAFVTLLLGTLFLSLSVAISVLVWKPEKASLYSNLLFLVMFLVGILYDILENAEYLRWIAPLHYFPAKELIMREISIGYFVLSGILIGGSLLYSFLAFPKRELINR